MKLNSSLRFNESFLRPMKSTESLQILRDYRQVICWDMMMMDELERKSYRNFWWFKFLILSEFFQVSLWLFLALFMFFYPTYIYLPFYVLVSICLPIPSSTLSLLDLLLYVSYILLIFPSCSLFYSSFCFFTNCIFIFFHFLILFSYHALFSGQINFTFALLFSTLLKLIEDQNCNLSIYTLYGDGKHKLSLSCRIYRWVIERGMQHVANFLGNKSQLIMRTTSVLRLLCGLWPHPPPTTHTIALYTHTHTQGGPLIRDLLWATGRAGRSKSPVIKCQSKMQPDFDLDNWRLVLTRLHHCVSMGKCVCVCVCT